MEAAYRQRLEELRGLLPESIYDLAKPWGIEDGLMVRVLHDRNAGHLKITIRCGHLQMGYYDLVLDYFGVCISAEHDQTLAAVARANNDFYNQRDLRYQELDLLDDGRIEHRLMFRPGVWIQMVCDELKFERVPKPNRKLPRFKDRYPGEPSASIISQLLNTST